VEKYGRAGQATDDNVIRHMRIACWITKATDTHSEYVILNAFPRQQWFRERVSMLRYAYIVCLDSNRDGVFTARYELNL
jgi:endonuclease III